MKKYEEYPIFKWFTYASLDSLMLLEVNRNEDTYPPILAGLVAKESA